MTDSSVQIRLSRLVRASAERLARADGRTLEEWIAYLVKWKVLNTEPAEEFFKHTAAGARPGGLLELLKKAGNEPPMPGDEMPRPTRRRPRLSH